MKITLFQWKHLSALLFILDATWPTVFGDFCKTPKNQPGDCIPMRNCKELFQILKKRPVSQSDILYLQESTCDISGSQPKVCCPTSSNNNNNSGKIPPWSSTTTTTTTTERTTTTTKPTYRTSRPAPTTSDLFVQNLASHRNYLLLPNVTECGRSVLTDQSVADRIIGGQDAGLGSYPWMALLGFSASDDEAPQYACGGTLINSRYVLTAAHCVANLPYGYKLKTIRLGEYDQRNNVDCERTESGRNMCAPPVQDMEIDQVIAHEEYDKSKSRENDIALIRLKKHAALGPYVSPVCIPHGEKLARAGTENQAFVSGWGRLAYDNPENAPVLQVVKLRLVSMDECNRFYAHKENFGDFLDEGRFCAGGDKGMDSCKGDSGGPLMMPLRPKSLGSAVRIFQLGVVSLGPSRCGHAGQPALYTKISHFLKWIYDTIQQ